MSQTVCAGQSVTFSVNAGVTTSPTYQWRKNSVDIPGATNATYTVAATVAGDAGSYDVVVSGSCAGTATSTVAALTINALPNISGQPVAAQTVCEGSAASFTVTATGTGLTYQWKKNGVDIVGATGSDLHDTGDSDGKCRHLHSRGERHLYPQESRAAPRY
ncbi:MAG: hypothetical protein U5K79_22425 [Cyclobacteriaceae bacterium]|nr:hypothetical protein [Cyclobacteriaceae bacterium]